MKVAWDTTGKWQITQKNGDIYTIYFGLFKVNHTENVYIHCLVIYKLLIRF